MARHEIGLPRRSIMKGYGRMAGLVTPALLMAGCFIASTNVKAAESEDHPKITALLADAKAEAVELKNDSTDMESFTRSSLNWESYAQKIEMIKEHVNNTGKLLTKLQAEESNGSPWQQTAIKRIEPLLKELAANTEKTINYLNENKTKTHFSDFKDYVQMNCEIATNLEELIRDFVNYGEAKQKLDRLAEKLEITG
jgi:ABC-type Na+ efflux pump permease subunit